MKATIYEGDIRDTMSRMNDQTVQTVVTSPPYFGLRDYGHGDQIGLEATVDEYVAALVAVFRGVWRVLKDDGTLWVNLGDSYTSGNRTSYDEDDKLPQRQRRSGRPSTPEGLKPKNLIGIPWRVAFALQDDGWYLRSEIIWHKPNPMPESVTDRPTKSHEQIFLLSKSPRYYYDAAAIAEESSGVGGGGFSQAYAKNQPTHGAMRLQRPEDNGKRNKRSVWTVATQPFSEAHFATFPTKLIEPCILAGSREGDIVFDPFTGSGTTAIVALRHGRDFVGGELNPEYVQMAKRRITNDAPMFNTVEVIRDEMVSD